MQQKNCYTFSIEGFLSIRKRFDSGLTSLIFEDKNLIVKGGRALVLSNLYTALGSADPISRAKVGTGGSFDVEGLLLKTPTPEMTDLFTPQAVIAVSKSSEDQNVPSITLVASVDNIQANGLLLNEAGFFSTSGKMFNIKTFPSTLKNTSFSLDFEWVIRIV